ncbi:conserved hypothetical protein [Edwardsiella phage PEi26]|uniref:Uncharacterized protein n=1 Tax=Edwardsiella phage PEi26 TaxID=1608311 RepID=A0A0B6VRP1_9CAUD|nr:conserved hypothetical protein [Edwardsiella phage PEi26]
MYQAYLIEKFQAQPKWKGPQFDKGIYALRIRIDEIRNSYQSKDPEYMTGEFGPFKQFTTNLKRNTRSWLKAASIGNITFEGDFVTMIGQFEKNGSDFYFVPETEVHYDSPY